MTPQELLDRLPAPAASLAEAVSLAIRIEPQLLRKMRLELFRAADASTEADLWFSPVVELRAPSGIVFEPAVAQLLRERLALNPAELNAAWRVVESLHQHISPAIFTEERLAFLALAGKFSELRELLQSVVATLLSPRGQALSGWVARAIQRLPDEARQMEEAQMLAFGASLRLGESALLEPGFPPERAAAWAPWLSPRNLEKVAIGVALLDDAVEFGPVGRTRSHRLELPKTTPVLVEIRWHDGARARFERLRLQPNQRSVLEFGSGVQQVQILTVLGDSYRLALPAPVEDEKARKLKRVRPPRVHLTYDVEKGSAIEKVELPFIVGVLANLSGHAETAQSSPRDREFILIDRDNFDQVMASMNSRLTFQVNNRLTGELDDTKLHMELNFQSMADFHPAQIARQVKPLALLLDQRTRIARINSLLQQNEKLADLFMRALTLRARVSLPESPEASEAALNSVELISALEEDAVPKEQAGELLAAFLENLELPSPPRSADRYATDRIATLDALLSKQVSEIMHHPEFQAFEATWRGLRYLVDQSETGQMLKIRVWNVTKRDLGRDFESAAQFDQSAVFKKTFEEEYGVFGGEPFGVLIGAFEFTQEPQDLEILENMAQISAAAHAPFLAAASPSILNLKSFSSLAEPRDVSSLFTSTEFARWNNFRDSEESRYLGLTLPHILLRLPYGDRTFQIEEFRFEEEHDRQDNSQFLWGNAAFALAARITDAFARHQWCAAIRGVEGGGLVEGLPVYTFATEDGDVAIKCPTEIALSGRRELELSKAGFIPLVYTKGTDNAAFLSLSSVHKPRHYDSPDASANAHLSGQLPYIFAASRFAQYLKCMMRDKIGSFMTRDQIEMFLNRWIANYVMLDDTASYDAKAQHPLREARIDVQEIEGFTGAYRLVAFIRPHFQLEELTVSLQVTIDLPRPANAS